MTMSQTDIQDYAREAVKRPPDFGYWGDADLGGSWGFAGVGTEHRDSEPLEQSNAKVIRDDLQERFPNDVEVMHAGHWAVGWIDQILVRVYDESGEITDVFRACADYADRLADYPVLDEFDLSEREYNETLETLTQCYSVDEDALSAVAERLEYAPACELTTERVSEAYAPDWR